MLMSPEDWQSNSFKLVKIQPKKLLTSMTSELILLVEMRLSKAKNLWIKTDQRISKLSWTNKKTSLRLRWKLLMKKTLLRFRSCFLRTLGSQGSEKFILMYKTWYWTKESNTWSVKKFLLSSNPSLRFYQRPLTIKEFQKSRQLIRKTTPHYLYHYKRAAAAISAH